MSIPLWLLIYLPKSVQEREIKRCWAAKSEEAIRYAYSSNMEMVQAFSRYKDTNAVLYSIAEDCQQKLDDYVLPEMKRRGLDVKS